MKLDLNELKTTKIPLRFHANGGFRVLMVSDIHGGVGYNREQTVEALQALVDTACPDLVLFGGDTAGPGIIHIETTDQLRALLDDLSSPMENAGIPWAHVFGNHDNNYGVPNAEAEKVYESYPHCISKAGPEDIDGTGNYVLPVYDAAGEKILFNLFGLDSHQGMSEFRTRFGLPENIQFLNPTMGTGSGYDTVHFNQIMWYWQVSEALEEANGVKIPALMFMHIPTPEHALVSMYRDDCRFEGTQLEDVACTKLNGGLFSACLQRGDVKGIFCGHDHVNDFTGEYCGILLGYDGFLSYHAYHKNEIRGGRVFDLAADGTFTTKMLRIRDILGTKGDSVP